MASIGLGKQGSSQGAAAPWAGAAAWGGGAGAHEYFLDNEAIGSKLTLDAHRRSKDLGSGITIAVIDTGIDHPTRCLSINLLLAYGVIMWMAITILKRLEAAMVTAAVSG
ncbi:MAG: hypothetical protein R2880_18290 [Deinococcales bacterium]